MADDGSFDGRASPRPFSIRSVNNTASSRNAARPHYMTVGSGSTSASAAALIASLDDDSGYGGSITGDSYINDGSVRGWHPGLIHDMPTPSHTPTVMGEDNPAAENERRVLASHVHQLYYNQNRVALGRAINRTVDTLRDLQQMNSTWPAHYPSVQPVHEPTPSRPDPRPGMIHTQSTIGETHSQVDNISLRPGPRRAATSLGEASSAATTIHKPSEPAPERLITPQVAQDFSILKLDLKLQGLAQSEIAHSMDRRALASLLDGKINQSVRHLQSLRDRIEDTSSKVLVTGDLNAGKSTFCNALLRRKVLPEDQQPCTSIFCEVLDARENGGIEEVHAVHKDAVYNRNDESSYDVYTLQELEKIVTDNTQYMQCKVYVKDIRTIDESLLNNGVVDISIIDAPGLNSDSLKTTAVFARQEEIDVVVFVVSAANHFTLSAKEFIWNAAHEKAYIFIVVNGYDNIRDKERCKRMVLEQVANLSPRTFKESSELVHFVSSNAIPVAPAAGPPGGNPGSGGGSGSSGGSDPSSDDVEDDESLAKHGEPGSPPGKGKGKEREKLRDFEQLESALRRFVLEKRARSKLAPAKTYLLNVLTDLNTLAVVNRDVAQNELDRVTNELTELEPVYEQSKKARTEVSEEIERTIDSESAAVYKNTYDTLNTTITRVADAELGVPYPGLLNAFQYAEDLKTAMLDEIAAAVLQCEDTARGRAVAGVNAIKSLGLLHLGSEYTDMSFRQDLMFRRRKDALARQVDTQVEIWDFFDISGLWARQEKVAGTGMAMTVVGVLGGRLVGGVGWLDGVLGAVKVLGTGNVRRMIIPGIIATAVLSTTYLLLRIPTTLPPLLSARLATSLSTLNYTHLNAQRISTEVARVLRFPADQLRAGLERSVQSIQQQRADTVKVKRESEVARKYFGNLVRESGEGRRGVEAVDLEGAAPGVAGGYESGVLV
ncbi:mitofusin [Xylographa soralifera]|nr:mitofusin [Xylographa soralifera]